MSHGYARPLPISTDGTMAANSDEVVPSQKAVRTYVAAALPTVPATLRREMYIDAGAIVSRPTTGAGYGTVEATTNKEAYDTLDFDQTTSEYASFKMAMPDIWDRSTIKVKFYWTAASGSGTVTWGIQCVAVSDDDAIDTAFGTAQTVTDTFITAGDLHISAATAAITVGGSPALADMIWFQIYRDIADTLNADARLLGFAIQYTVNASEAAAW